MQKREIQLTDLVNYLPYNLQLICWSDCFILDSIGINGVVILKNNDGIMSSLIVNIGNQFLPVLKPMSKLYELKPNYDGSYHTEIETNFGGAFLDFNWSWTENSISCVFENGLKMYQSVPFEVFKYLFENHFDVFGWINDGLAIDYYSLNKK
jgi:hypothetical protein